MPYTQGIHSVIRDKSFSTCPHTGDNCINSLNFPFDHFHDTMDLAVTSHSINTQCTSLQSDPSISQAFALGFTDTSSLHIQASPYTQSCSFPFDREIGVKAISLGFCYTLLLTYSGEVYGWGSNQDGQLLYNGPDIIQSPIKLPLCNIVSISAGFGYSLALSSEGKLFGWGRNDQKQISKLSRDSLPITLIDISFNIKTVIADHEYSFALTQEGQVVRWGNGNSFELMEELNNIVFISMANDFFSAINGNGDFFCYHRRCGIFIEFVPIELPAMKDVSVRKPDEGSFSFNKDLVVVIDMDNNVWKFNNEYFVPFNNKPSKIEGLSSIVFISGNNSIYAAMNSNGKVFMWGYLHRVSNVYEISEVPICIEAFTDIEGISMGYNFLFAYNKNSVWAWGRNYEGQLGTGDLIDRPQPVKVSFGSEILGTFQYPKQPLDRMFSGLVKLVYWEYLNFLQKHFGNHPYVKARFYTKCGIGKRVAQFAKEVFNAHPIHNNMFLKDPQEFNLNENIIDLQLRLSTNYYGSKVINTRIKKLDVCYDEVVYDVKLLSLFPNVEVVKLSGHLPNDCMISVNLAPLSNLKCLEVDYDLHITQLPTSLVKLVLRDYSTHVNDLSYLTSLKELVVLSRDISEDIVKRKTSLPQSIVRLEVDLSDVNIELQLPNLRELVIYGETGANVTEQNFPSLKFIKLITTHKENLFAFPLSPAPFLNQRSIQSVNLIKNDCLVELSSFPWWIQYSAE
ncbi:hypothetical protein P9112_009564 [Eukaryota sp. TZLM1-RC]